MIQERQTCGDSFALLKRLRRLDHVADAPRNDVLGFAPRNDVPVACALNIPAGQWHTLRALESGTVILEMKDGAYEPIGAEDVMER